MRAALLLSLPVVAAILLAPAALDSSPIATGPWTVDDILLQEQAGGFEVSPDGRSAVWVKTRMDKKKGERVSNLMLSRLDGSENEIAVSRGRHRDSDPKWSPDGKRIAFLSTRPQPGKEGEEKEEKKRAKAQLWLVDARGGEPWPLTKLDRTIRSFDWRDEDTIVYAADEAKSLRELLAQEDKDTSQVVEVPEETAPIRLFEVDVADGEVSRLTENDDWIAWVKVSPDGRWAVALHERSLSFKYDHSTPPVIQLHDLASGDVRTLFEGERVLITGADWSPDSTGLYLVQSYSSDPVYFTATVQRLHYADVESAKAEPVELDWPRGLATSRVRPTSDGFLALLADGVRYRPARYIRSGSGWTRQDLSGPHVKNLFDWTLGGDGTVLVYEHSTATTPTQWFQATLEGSTIGEVTQLTDLNPGFRDKRVHAVRVERWKGAQDEEVEGLLYFPIDYEEGRRYPLFLSIHGGPTGYDMDRWDQSYAYPKLLIAQKGAFLLEVNYHGSGNYGLEWVESICCGSYYDLERVDLENGVDHVIGLGLADPEKLASTGWSNGAILTTELVTRSSRYKVASAGAGDVEWISDWANVDFGASFDNYYFGAAPYEDPDLYIRKSPYFRLKDVTTPTILYTGTEDRNVPPSQSWSHFRVMQQVGRTPVRLVLFPGEPHGLRKYVHQKRKVVEDLAWFDQHLFGTESAAPVVKEGSPLEAALARAGSAAVAGLYGRRVAETLVPEAVSHEGLRVSRFEVTRAQYAAFDPQYAYPDGTGNFPASGITFEQARAYAEWLAELTGESWRLPRAGEAETLYGTGNGSAGGEATEDASRGENTLDYWAGYTPNPEDADQLRLKAAALGGKAPLLKEVGWFRREGAEVFDLGGNVAEWTLGEDGTGVLAGGSADLSSGTASASALASEPYRGFRVVATP